MRVRPAHLHLFALAAVCCAPTLAFAQDPPAAVVTYLGVTTKATAATVAAEAKLPAGVGLVVTFVDAKGPLAAADVRVGDVLHKLDDQLLVNAAQLVTLIRLHQPGEAVTLTRLRDGRAVAVRVTLGQKRRPADATVPPVDDPAATDNPPPLPFDPAPPVGPRVAVSYDDGTYAARVETDPAGHRRMTVTDAATGKPVAAGPVDTDPQWQAFPADVRAHLQKMREVMAARVRPTLPPPGPATRPVH